MRNNYPVAAHIFFLKDDQVLLLRRFNTGYEDGNYSVPAGHCEVGESITACAIRESWEEVGVEVGRDALKFSSVMHRKSKRERIDFFFVVTEWEGIFKNMEQDKCDDLCWFPINQLPENTIAYVRRGIESINDGGSFHLFGWSNENESTRF